MYYFEEKELLIYNSNPPRSSAAISSYNKKNINISRYDLDEN